jgi:hypothetical protein
MLHDEIRIPIIMKISVGFPITLQTIGYKFRKLFDW